jgi:flagellar biosynthetic protein FliO
MTAMDWPRFVLSSLFVLGLMAALLWWLKRRQTPWTPGGQGRRIRLLETLPLGLKHKMLLVQVDQQMMLVAVTGQDIRTLHAWTGSAQGPEGAPDSAAGQSAADTFPPFSAGGRAS